MIVVGDIACPTASHSKILEGFFKEQSEIFKNRNLICNFEGLICDDIDLNNSTPVLYNHSSVLPVLKEANVMGLGLANNHTLDLPDYFRSTKEQLAALNIPFNGAGNSKAEAEEPIVMIDKFCQKKVIQFSFCWDFLLYHQKNPSQGVYVAEINESQLIEKVRQAKLQYSDAVILIFVHWSFDLETLPFPMYRSFSKALIDVGADCVIGAHSHCVQGGEKYKDGYIVYGLGNFYLPNNVFAGGKLKFPPISSLEMAFEFNLLNREAKCHWFEYKNDDGHHYLNYVASERFENSKILRQYSPYAQMSHVEYIKFFKKNRRKKFLVPIYSDYQATHRNRMFTWMLKKRAIVLRTLAKYKIRDWQN